MTGTVSADTVDEVRRIVAAIPRGSVTTYGDVAAAAGLRSARTVGWILRTDGADLPWHRVIRADGTLPAHLAQRQSGLLQSEGVEVRDRRVNVAAHRYRP